MLKMTYRIDFTEAVVKELKERLSSEKSAKISRRLLWLDLKHRNYSQNKIKSYSSSFDGSINKLVKAFFWKGFNGLCSTNYKIDGRQSSPLMWKRLNSMLGKLLFRHYSSLQGWIKEGPRNYHWAELVEPFGLKKLHCFTKKLAWIPGKLVDVKIQEAFIEKMMRTVEEARKGKEIVIFIDPVHQVHNNENDYAWQFKGQEGTKTVLAKRDVGVLIL